MARYCVNTNEQYGSNDHEVHNLEAGCPTLPRPEHRLDLGEHTYCRTAVIAASTIDPTADGCAHCAPDCHTS